MPQITVVPTSTSSRSGPAPGWAYVVDTGYDPSKAAINPSGKRRRAAAGPAKSSEASAAAAQVRLNKRIALLDSDASAREVNVPGRKGKGGVFVPGNTANTRRILLSGKRFDNYLADEEAELRNAAAPRPSGHRAVDLSRRVSTVPRAPFTPSQSHPPDSDAIMSDAPAPTPYDAFLHTSVPIVPSAEELAALVAAPPLSYNAARVAPPPADGPPVRRFCAMCGYWGRIKCMRCGERVCRLECKRQHDSACGMFG